MLVAQWVWYERLQHGQPLRVFKRWREGIHNTNRDEYGTGNLAFVEGVAPYENEHGEEGGEVV